MKVIDIYGSRVELKINEAKTEGRYDVKWNVKFLQAEFVFIEYRQVNL